VRRPQRWDVEHPYLYRLVTEVVKNGRSTDRDVSVFGIRTIEFDRDRGLSLNGRHLKFHGVCLHHDLGALGAAVNRRAIERQLQILKAAGVNAIRTSHNPPAPELLEYADRLGLLVVDEAFDMWRIPKVANGSSKFFDEWSERDLRDMIRRDRNHPSVVLWSIGNEVPEQGDSGGWRVARRLAGIVHDEDPSRRTTAAFDNVEGAIANGLAAEVDVPGFNYKPTRYALIRETHPDWIIYGSETASCVSSRGTYHLPLEKYAKHSSLQISSYDIIAPPWAYCPDVEFAAQDAEPALLGEFVWTGFDYLGEPTPYFGQQADNSKDWPARSSYFGMVDLAGFPKDRYYLYQSVWTEQPMVHLLPHWNWQGHEGQNIPVMAYSNADEVELSLNGRSLGRKRVRSEPVELPVGPNVSATLKFASKYRLLWQVPYQAGLLQAVAYRGGAEVARDAIATAGAPSRIRLVADRQRIAADGDDLAFITVRIEDRDGHLCPDADDLVHFKVTGAATIAAVDNGNPATLEAFHADFHSAFHGLALLIVRSSPHKLGRIRIAAIADGLDGSELQLRARLVTPVADAPP
jgi:beta-galactosidase